MNVLDLTKAAQLWHGGQELSELWISGQRRWNRSAKLSDFHGVGPGQIPLDLRADSPEHVTRDASGAVSRVGNAGAVGAAFDLLGAGATRPIWNATAGGLDFDGLDDAMSFAASPDLRGVHLIAAITIKNTGVISNYPVFDTSAGQVYYTNRYGVIDWRYQFTDGSTYYRLPVTYGAWNLAEIRCQGGMISLYWNGVRRGSQALTSIARNVTTVGRSTQAGTSRFPGLMSRVVGVICDPAYSADLVEPAVTAARLEIAAQRGIALP